MQPKHLRFRCIHYWVIDSDSMGYCRYCGEHKDFRESNKKVFHRDYMKGMDSKMTGERLQERNQGFCIQGAYHDDLGRLYTFEDNRGIYNDRY